VSPRQAFGRVGRVDHVGGGAALRARLEGLFDGAGVRGWVHARRVDDMSVAPTTGAARDHGDALRDGRRDGLDAYDPGGVSEEGVGLGADAPVAMASLYKLPLAVAWAELADAGELDPLARIIMTPGQRTPGPTGVSTLSDDVEVSVRDAVRLMVTLSDNASADHVLELVGLDRVEEALRRWGLHDTHVRHGSADSQRQVQRDTAVSDPLAALDALTDLDHDVRTAEYDAARASTSTARDLATLLALLWSGRVAAGPHGELVRDAMRRQVFRHRLASGFPHDDVVTAGKTGTLGILRHEAGVVSFPGEVPVAVAVLTCAARPERHLPVVDAVIGDVARTVVEPLRRPLPDGRR
jgi:beta-lactamase class A